MLDDGSSTTNERVVAPGSGVLLFNVMLVGLCSLIVMYRLMIPVEVYI